MGAEGRAAGHQHWANVCGKVLSPKATEINTHKGTKHMPGTLLVFLVCLMNE